MVKRNAMNRNRILWSLGAIVVLALIGLMVGCASMQPDLSPNQRLYASIAEYNAIAELAADYCEQPNAIPAVKQAIERIDEQASRVILSVNAGVFTAQEISESLKPLISELKEQIREVWNEDR